MNTEDDSKPPKKSPGDGESREKKHRRTVCVETSDRPTKIGSLNKPCDQGREHHTRACSFDGLSKGKTQGTVLCVKAMA